MDNGQLGRFFNELRPRLEMAREMDARLNRETAYRFNVFSYLKTSELGLSRVIADLFDPDATHGQGHRFLEIFLQGLQSSSETSGRLLDLRLVHGGQWKVKPGTVRVEVERTIPSGRRLDVSVDFEGNDGRRRCLVIENKPYARDQNKQVHDYLKFMKKEYGNRDFDHLLIYLSPVGELPSKESVKKKRRDQVVREGIFAVMAYSAENIADSLLDVEGEGETDPRLSYSLKDWFKRCRKECDVERLRNFLRDAEAFCQQHLGGASMANLTAEQICDFLKRPENWPIASEVHRHWPNVRADIVKQFAERLTSRIDERLRDGSKELGDLRCENLVTGHDTTYQAVKVFRGGNAWCVDGHNVEIRMENQRRGLGDWFIGVSTGKTKFYGVLEGRLKEEHLKKGVLASQKRSQSWPWYERADRWQPWHDHDLVPKLDREREEAGEITRYFVDRVVAFCEVVVPIIDEEIGRYRSGD